MDTGHNSRLGVSVLAAVVLTETGRVCPNHEVSDVGAKVGFWW
jgi:hypothetical protein